MDVHEDLHRARVSFAEKAWADARVRFTAVDREAPLDRDDLMLLSAAAYLVGRDDESADAMERAHREYVRLAEPASAARCAFWLALPLFLRGDMARGGGWIARGQRLIDSSRLDCVEQGFLLIPIGIRSLVEGDHAAGFAVFDQVVKIGDRFRDADLLALGRQCLARAMIGLGDTAEGLALLDEVMIAVTAGEVSPIPAGVIYCSVIEACHEVFDLHRAHEWTAALSQWCGSQPDLVPFRGQCLVHRSQVLQARGAWAEAFDEVRSARDRLSSPAGQPALGMAFYQYGELHRLRGAFAAAEEAYGQASECGHPAQPGLAQLRLAQGRIDDAATAIRLAVRESLDRARRARVLAPFAEIVAAAGDVAAAQVAAAELTQIAEDLASPLLTASAAQARGAALLAAGDASAALDALAGACQAWATLGMPYDGARSRILTALARRQLGDADTAKLELAAAGRVFQQLGAGPDLARVDALLRPAVVTDLAGGLSRREVEVLRLVAAGLTNHAIAAELFLSDKTVARHLSNIFTKLDISSRAAATAYAYEHDLI